MPFALSFDLEEWYHPEAIRTSGMTFTKTAQVAAATTPILDLLAQYGVRATFFTVGEVAAENPQLIERILHAGHELAFHGWTHKPLWALDAESFAGEIEQFLNWRDAHCPGVKILGYRAPTFSLDHTTAWAVAVLRQHGFTYDSSIFPARTPLYGVPNAPRQPYFINGDDLTTPAEAGLLEIPMSVFALGGARLGFTGGLYLRALPLWVVKAMLRRTPQARLYIHPWETHAATPRLSLPFGSRFILYTGLPALKKLEKLLQTFDFDTMQNIFLAKTKLLL